MIARLLCGLTPRQAGIVVCVFFASSIAAILLAWWFRRRNLHHLDHTLPIANNPVAIAAAD
jgi:hypothetical protein